MPRNRTAETCLILVNHAGNSPTIDVNMFLAENYVVLLISRRICYCYYIY
jgi:hypothetical protein